MTKKPKILIIYTGGTIGMIEDPETKSLQPFDFAHLIDNVPKIRLLNYEIDNLQFNPPIDSSDMQPDHWVDMATSIYDNYGKYDGFVVLHGTDTMAYTASALSFMLENLAKPVIITGSQTERKISSPLCKSQRPAPPTAARWCRKWQSSLKTIYGEATAAPK